ncbi:unnamed protein product [Rotaria sp. Silwood1]|nr:unnamed protein product [Rotaria sp. Silwood1]CAF1581392.1 unnamed protein product [Rotaria sp. Silwood1]
MYSKQYLLLTILFTTIILSLCTAQNPGKSVDISGAKKNVVHQDKNNDDDTDDDSDDDPSSDYGRQPPYNVADVGYRIRSRWPPAIVSPSYELLKNQMDWSRFMNRNMVPPSSPPLSYNTNPMLNMGTSCKSLIDPQYPIFSDMCGAVPQARYGLPNTFGHYDRWQLAHLLTTLIGSTTDPVCIRSLRHLLCPMLFQPCRVRHEPPLVLPCQYYCRAVKTQCNIPALDVIPCDLLPMASDICPNIQPFVSVMSSGSTPAETQPVATQNAVPSADQQTARSFTSQSFKQTVPSTVNVAPAPSPVSSMQTQTPVNFYNRRPYENEGIVDHRQASRYTPLTQSTFKTRPTVDYYTSNEARVARGPMSSAFKN